MVCERCIAAVRESLEELGIGIDSIHLGEVFIRQDIPVEMNLIAEKLQQMGFSLVTNKKQFLFEETIALVAEVYSGEFDFPQNFRFSAFAEERLETRYDLISSVFSKNATITLEKYIIEYRINKIKEFLVYSNYMLDDIAFKLDYSSKAHLSGQFKLITGMTTSHFKNIKSQKDTLLSGNKS